MLVFVSEFVCGGGWDENRPPPPSLLAEGTAMWQAVVTDFAAVCRVVTTWDTRLGPCPLPPAKNATIIPVDGPRAERRVFCEQAACCDQTFVIAPETSGILEDRRHQVETARGVWVGCSAETIRLTADKLATAAWLEQHQIATPATSPLSAPPNPNPQEGHPDKSGEGHPGEGHPETAGTGHPETGQPHSHAAGEGGSAGGRIAGEEARNLSSAPPRQHHEEARAEDRGHPAAAAAMHLTPRHTGGCVASGDSAFVQRAETADVDSAAELVIKLRDGAGSLPNFVVNTEAAFTAGNAFGETDFAAAGHSPAESWIVQPLIRGTPVSVGVLLPPPLGEFSRAGDTFFRSGVAVESPARLQPQVLPVMRQFIERADGHLVYRGSGFPAGIPGIAGEHLLRTARRIVDLLPGDNSGYVGIDAIVDDAGGVVVVEINPRLCTSYLCYRRLFLQPLAAAWMSGSVCDMSPRVPTAKYLVGDDIGADIGSAVRTELGKASRR